MSDSAGGLIGIHLASRYPQRIRSAVLCNTNAWMPPPEKWNERIEQVRAQGMDGMALTSFRRWLASGVEEQRPEVFSDLVQRARAIPVQGYVNLCVALRDADERQSLADIRVPTLVVGSSADVIPVEQTRALAAAIPGGEVCVLDNAGHLSNVDQPQAFNAALRSFLRKTGTT